MSELFQELDELLIGSERPSAGLLALQRAGAFSEADGRLPEIGSLRGVPQNPTWHPEGDVWTHTLMVVDEAVRQRPADPDWARVLMWAALCHDLGKPLCTIYKDGAWRSPGHDREGVRPTRELLARLTDGEVLPEGFIEQVCALVLDHLAPHFFYKRASLATIRRLLLRLRDVPLDLLVRLGRADSWGRTTEDARRREYRSGEWLLEQAARIDPHEEPEGPPPIIKGRHLLALGIAPGPEMGRLLKRAYEGQVEGRFADVEGGLAWLGGHALRSPS